MLRTSNKAGNKKIRKLGSGELFLAFPSYMTFAVGYANVV
jgi:hypothetical protein